MISKVVSAVSSKIQCQQPLPDPSPVNEIFKRKVASSCCYEYPVRNKNEMQGAKHVFTKKQNWPLSRFLEFYRESQIYLEILKIVLYLL